MNADEELAKAESRGWERGMRDMEAIKEQEISALRAKCNKLERVVKAFAFELCSECGRPEGEGAGHWCYSCSKQEGLIR